MRNVLGALVLMTLVAFGEMPSWAACSTDSSCCPSPPCAFPYCHHRVGCNASFCSSSPETCAEGLSPYNAPTGGKYFCGCNGVWYGEGICEAFDSNVNVQASALGCGDEVCGVCPLGYETVSNWMTVGGQTTWYLDCVFAGICIGEPNCGFTQTLIDTNADGCGDYCINGDPDPDCPSPQFRCDDWCATNDWRLDANGCIYCYGSP